MWHWGWVSVFSIDYHVFRAFFGEPGRVFLHNWCFISSTHGGNIFDKASIHPSIHLSCLSAVCSRPLDTVRHLQVPSFLCLGCRPLNGVINVSPKGNFHSQLPKETVSCDAFLLDINRSREGQVMEGKQAESMLSWQLAAVNGQKRMSWISFCFQQRCFSSIQASCSRPDSTFLTFAFCGRTFSSHL